MSTAPAADTPTDVPKLPPGSDYVPSNIFGGWESLASVLARDMPAALDTSFRARAAVYDLLRG